MNSVEATAVLLIVLAILACIYGLTVRIEKLEDWRRTEETKK